MPQFLAAIGTSFLSGFGASAAFIAANAVAFGVLITGFVTFAALGTTRSRVPGDGGNSAGDQQVMVRSASEPRKIVYGEAVVSGPMFWANTTVGDAFGGSLYVAVALTGHEIDSFQGFYLDDKFVAIADVDTAGDGSVDSGSNYPPVDGTPVLYLRIHLGSSSQTVDTALDSAFALWTSNHRARGVAYFVARMDRLEGAEEVWEQGAPTNMKALVRGKKVYDPRLDSTFTGTWGTGSGAHRVATPSTWAYSTNPALCLADYLIDAALGAGWDSARINYNSVAFAADDCDDLVDIPTSTTQKRFTCNGVLSCLDTHRENIEKIISSMAGTLRYFAGQWHIAAGVWPTSSSFALTESDLVGDITYRPQPERSERFNAVRGLYFDPDRFYQENAYLPAEDATLQSARDDGLVLWREIDLPMVNEEYQAQRLALRMLEQASRTGVCVFPMGYRGMDIAPGDRGTVTISELGWSAKTFRCVGLRHVDMVGVELVLKEDDSAAYDDPAEGDYGTRSAASVVTFPRTRRDTTLGGGSLLHDPLFSRLGSLWNGSGYATGEHLGYYWRMFTGTSPTDAQILRTGGLDGGVLEITGASDGSDSTVTSIPRRGPASVISGERLKIIVRVRKRFSTTVTTGGLILVVGLGIDDGEVQDFGSGGFSWIAADINAWTIDEWQDELTEVVVTAGATVYPYAIAYIEATAFDFTATFEIDTFNVVRVSQ